MALVDNGLTVASLQLLTSFGTKIASHQSNAVHSHVSEAGALRMRLGRPRLPGMCLRIKGAKGRLCSPKQKTVDYSNFISREKLRAATVGNYELHRIMF